ncbi:MULTISPECIES: right-handed parallel beta-helix repeat-containing protein [Streptomyces]|uniref:right-handed parallel beta-helix repeat-containing protein n=2 Tax=Bacteria TaxID=2 RepID=UPI0021D13B84|nr:right-handed parallel beta-helix repeat-containing protein [Streptomyces sp. NEAU-383]
MTQYTYGGSPADVLTTATGDVVPDYPLIVRVAGTGETITALFEADGTTPIAQLRSNPATSDQPGAIRPFKVEGVTQIEYEYNGMSGPVRWYEAGREVAQEAFSKANAALPLSGGTMTGKIQNTATDVNEVVDASFIAGDTFDRYRRLASGEEAYGPGNAAREVRWFRSGSATQRLTATLDADQVSLGGMRVYNPRVLFGAKGDGVADDAPAIQAALDAVQTAGGGQVLIPPGTYRLATLPLRIWRKTRLTLMPGTVMQRAADATVITNGAAGQDYGGYTGHGDLVIEGGVWDMRGTTSGLTASRMCISLGHAQNILIRDTEVRDVPGYHAIEVNACKDVRILTSRFVGFVNPGGRDFSEAIQPDLAKGSAYFGAFGPYDHTPCEDLLVSGCYFGPSGTAGTQAWPRGIGSHSATITKWHRRVRVIGNTFEGCPQYAMTAYNYEDVTFEGNTVTGCGAGFRAQPPVTTDPNDTQLPDGTQTNASQAVKNFAVVGNTFRALTGNDDAVTLDGVPTGKVMNVTIVGNVIDGSGGIENGVRLIHAQQVTVTGNTVRGAAGTGISQDNVDGATVTGNRIYAPGASGVSCDTGTGVLIANNTVRDAGTNGVHILGGSEVQAMHNMIRSPSRSASGNYGIRVSSTADRITIVGNTVRKNGSGNEAAYGLSVTNTCTNIRRWGNDIADSGTSGPLDDQSVGSEISPFDMQGNLEGLMRPAGRFETTSRLRCGTTSAALVSGTLYLVPIWLPRGTVVSNLAFTSGGTGAGTPTNWWFTLHDRDRKALARSTDQTTAAWAANTTKTLAVAQTTAGNTSSYTTTYSGLHYLGFMIKATTTPSLVGEGSVATGGADAPGFGDTNTGQSGPPTVSGAGFTAAAFGGNLGPLAYGYVS